jgi:ribose transport system permease protein
VGGKGLLETTKHPVQFLMRIGMLPLVLLALMVFFGVLEPRFMSLGNLSIVSRQVAFLVIIACAQMIPILTGGVDLSVGSIAGLMGIITCLATKQVGVIPGIVAGIIGGALVGLVNGGIIGRFRVAPFVVTLGMLSMARGLALTITSGQTVYGLPRSFRILGANYIFSIPIPVIVAGGVIGLTFLILTKTRFGRYIYAIGGNSEAARLSGINVGACLAGAYIFCGAIAGLNAVLLSSRVGSGPPNLGSLLELDAIAAVVIGGVPLSGGQGKLSGVVFGAIILGILSNGFDLLNVSSFIQMIVIGGMIVLALIADKYRRH